VIPDRTAYDVQYS